MGIYEHPEDKTLKKQNLFRGINQHGELFFPQFESMVIARGTDR